MMDGTNLRLAAPGGEAPIEQIDWRNQLQTDTRQRIVNKIIETLKGCLSYSGPEGLQELKRIAVRFEEKIYSTASSQPDYLRKISLKMLTVENQSQNPNTGPTNPTSNSNRLADTVASHSVLSPNQNQPQVQRQLVAQSVQNNMAPGGVSSTAGLNSNTQNMPSISQACGGNQMGQVVPSNVFSGSQSQMLGRQHVVPPQQQTQAQSSQYLYQQQQLLKLEFLHGISSQPIIQSHIPQNQQYGMHNSGVVQPSLMQSTSLNCLQQNQPMIQHSTSSMLQQHQQQLVTPEQQAAIVHQQRSHMMQQPSMGHQASPGNMQQNQLTGQQNSFSDRQQRVLQQNNNLQNLQQERHHQRHQQNQLQQKQKLVAQLYNLPNSHQQQLGAQNNVGLPQQQLLGLQSGYSGIPTNHHSVYMLQQPKVPTQQQPQPGGTGWLASQGKQSQSQAPQQQSFSQMQSSDAQLQHQLSSHQQSDSMQLNLQQRVQGPGEATASPAAQSGQVNGGVWHEESYQKVKRMRDNFLPELTELYQKVVTKLQQHDSMAQPPKSDQHDNLKKFKQLVERLLHVLQMPKSNISPAFMQNIVSYEKQIQTFLCSNRPRKPMQQGLAQPHMQGFQPGLNMDSVQGSSLGSLQQVAVGSLQQNSVSASQHPSISSFCTQSGVSMMQPNNPMQSNSNMLQHQHLKQPEQQMPQAQKLKQQFQMQLHTQQITQEKQQSHHQSKQQRPARQMGPIHSINDANEMKVRKGMKSGVYQQHPTMGQHASYPHQQIKSETTFPTSSSQMLPAASPQLPQHSSPQFDQQSNLSSLAKTGTPLQSANSPFIAPSPSTPLAPSPMPGNSEIHLSSSLSNVSHQQTLAVPSLPIATPGISASPLHADFTGVDGDHGGALTTIHGKPNVLEQPLERLLKVVESLSPKALSDSVSDISSVVSMINRIAGSSPSNGSRAAVGEDLVAMTKCHLQGRNCVTQDWLSGTRKMKRYISAMPMNVVSSVGSISDSFKQLTGSDATDLESTATSGVKRPRMEANHMLVEEIREINRRLIDTVVDIGDEDTDPRTATATTKLGEGTVVKCSFCAVTLSPDLKSQMSPIQPLRLLVPTNYPNSSPILMDKFPVEVCKEDEDLSVKAKSRFSIYLRSLSQPMSLGEIARTWDKCTRAVVCEHAQQSGGGTFSFKYGAWESCLSSA